MMDTKNALTKGQSASLSVGADTNVSTLIRHFYQANAVKPLGTIHTEEGAE